MYKRATSYNSGHTATLRYAQISHRGTSYVRETLSAITFCEEEK